MGQLYAWLRAKAPSARAREMLYLMRLGFEVHCGHRQELHLGAAAAAPASASAMAERPDGGPHAGAGFTHGFDLASLCNPSLPE